MDKGYEKERFESLSIKSSVICKFRKFCKKNAASQSMTLLQMVQFFQFNGIAPTDNLGDSIAKLEGKISKRINAAIAIIKNIEKHQTKPTTAMLQSLFEQHLEDEDDEFIELKFADTPKEEKAIIETSVPKIRYIRLEEKMNSVKEDFTYVLDKVKVVKSSFGKNHLRLELSEDELVKFKRTLKKT